MVDVYPVPALSIVTVLILSPTRVAVAVAVTYPLPSGGGVIWTVGTPVYPEPTFVRSRPLIVPVSETSAVARATTTSSWDIILIESCKVSLLAAASLTGLKKGLVLST